MPTHTRARAHTQTRISRCFDIRPYTVPCVGRIQIRLHGKDALLRSYYISSCIQQIRRTLRNPENNYRVHHCPPSVPTPNHISQNQSTTCHPVPSRFLLILSYGYISSTNNNRNRFFATQDLNKLVKMTSVHPSCCDSQVR